MDGLRNARHVLRADERGESRRFSPGSPRSAGGCPLCRSGSPGRALRCLCRRRQAGPMLSADATSVPTWSVGRSLLPSAPSAACDCDCDCVCGCAAQPPMAVRAPPASPAIPIFTNERRVNSFPDIESLLSSVFRRASAPALLVSPVMDIVPCKQPPPSPKIQPSQSFRDHYGKEVFHHGFLTVVSGDSVVRAHSRQYIKRFWASVRVSSVKRARIPKRRCSLGLPKAYGMVAMLGSR